ncbi:MAG: DUF3108 domain-containing protein [Caldimicrobium sp.]|nr:DUF3108 domain-containing protein [Caldimicrobium sp.]
MIRIVSIFLSCLILHSTSAKAEFKLYYEIFYGPVKLGESQISIDNKKYVAEARTTGIGNTIYPYFAKWTTEINAHGYPIKSHIFSKDRFKEREKIIAFDPQQKTVHLQKLLPKRKTKTILLPFPLYDELTAFVSSWYLNFNNTSVHELPLYIDEERHMVKINYKRSLSCTFHNKTYSCLEIQALLPDKSELLRRSKEVLILLWKEESIPLEIKGVIPIFGSLTARLKTYSRN